MATKIRLKRIGRRNRPFYRIIVIDSRKRRDGSEIELLGWYNPMEKNKELNYKINENRLIDWLKEGAQPTDPINKIMKRSGLAYKWHLIQQGLDEEKIAKALDEWKKEREEIAQAREIATENGVAPSELPKTPEELEEFREKYPDMYAIVETVSTIQAERKLKTLQEEVQTLKGREEELKIQSAYKELLNQHPDFNTLRTDEKFLAWLDDQPESIADGIYKNNTDVKWASRVLDLYKADTGMRKTTKKKDADPAATVTKATSKDVTPEKGDKKIWTASEIRKLKPWQFEKVEAEIDAARAEGRVDLTK
jgi:small subunit ribosomal protein S16